MQMSTNSSKLDKLWCGHIVGHHTAMKKNHHAQRHRWASLKNVVTKECVLCNYIDIWGSGPDRINLWVAPQCPKHMPKPVRGDREASEGEKWAVLGARVATDILPSALAQWHGQSRCAVNAYRHSSVQEWTSSLVPQGCFHLERYKCLTYKSVPLDTKRSEWNGLRTPSERSGTIFTPAERCLR